MHLAPGLLALGRVPPPPAAPGARGHLRQLLTNSWPFFVALQLRLVLFLTWEASGSPASCPHGCQPATTSCRRMSSWSGTESESAERMGRMAARMWQRELGAPHVLDVQCC